MKTPVKVQAEKEGTMGSSRRGEMSDEQARLLLKKHCARYGDKAYEPARWVVDAIKEAAGVVEEPQADAVDLQPPVPESQWRHHNGNLYTVLLIANEHTQRPDEYPVTVVYRGENGRVWSRPLSRWAASMTPEFT